MKIETKFQVNKTTIHINHHINMHIQYYIINMYTKIP